MHILTEMCNFHMFISCKIKISYDEKLRENETIVCKENIKKN